MLLNPKLINFQEGTHRKESGKRGRKPGRKSAEKVDMKAKLGNKHNCNRLVLFINIYLFLQKGADKVQENVELVKNCVINIWKN